MNIISFATAETDWKVPRPGIVLTHGGQDTRYRLDCEKLFAPPEQPRNPLSWFDLDGPWLKQAREVFDHVERDAAALDHAGEKGWLVPAADAYWFAPVPRPGKLICIGLNYRDHAKESNMQLPEKPVVFSKFSSAVIAPGEPVVLPPTSQQVDYEAELAVVIGRFAKNVSADRAYDYVLGYTAFNDVTARDFQFGDGQWQRGKSCDTFAPMGQAIVTTDVINDPHKLAIKLTLNGEVMQDSNTDQLIFGVPRLIEFISQTITLEPGDVIATGTPAGVSKLAPGDVVEIEVVGVSSVRNTVTADQ